MTTYSILIDVKKCSGCFNCFLACRDEFCGNDYPGYSAAQPMSGQYWMQIQEIERGEFPKPKVDYIPKPCMHCADAPCLDATSNGSVYRRKDGIVMIDPEKAKGLKEIVGSCPYRRIEWNDVLQVAQKCTLCAHRLDEGEKLPRCVESCPTGALVFGDLDDPTSEISLLAKALPVEELHPEYATKPGVKYVGIPKRFVAGEVVFGDKVSECAEGVKVQLVGAGMEMSTATDLFGDFEFEGLEKNKNYKLTVTADGYSTASLDVVTLKDVNLGEIVLAPR
jgi:Fe-S-cluster-containing dehydrogenase component